MMDAKQDYINYRIKRAEEIYQDAQLLFENKRWRSCVNRLYYSSFQLVGALMMKHGITAKSHDGLKTKFLQLFIKTKKINVDYGRLYSQLIDWRQESDYADFVDFSEADVAPLMEKVNAFNTILIELINKDL
ncbi:HEPN domain-containing protein [Saccharicrinis sp. FJH2]|uniref:HEPN domain-containing protein n=1 Tax=Saccharicrinis sp. FJH65 TaxID=3344659 RepID=UPI0035F2433D